MKPGKVGGILSFTDTEGKHLFPSLGMIPAVEILGAPLLTESGDKGLKNAAFLPDSSPNCPYLTTFFLCFPILLFAQQCLLHGQALGF